MVYMRDFQSTEASLNLLKFNISYPHQDNGYHHESGKLALYFGEMGDDNRVIIDD